MLTFTLVAALVAAVGSQHLDNSGYIEDTNYLEVAESTTVNRKVCYKAKCHVSHFQCISRVSTNLAFSQCPDNFHCKLNSEQDGFCVQKPSQEPIEYLYPGDNCLDYVGNRKVCAFGFQQCSYRKCKGYKETLQCNMNQDCEAGLFCAEDNTCQKTYKVGQECTIDDQCGRQAMCYFNELSNPKGKCHEFFSIQNDATLIVLNAAGGDSGRLSSSYNRLMCVSGVVDNNGRCTSGLGSLNKGIECFSDLDCPSKTDKNVVSSCQCVFSQNSTSYCDLHYGDEEWQASITAFKAYFKATKSCHVSQRWGPCNQNILFRDWKCKEAKAKYFNHLKHAAEMDCLNYTKLAKELPYLAEYHEYCYKGNIFVFGYWMVLAVLSFTVVDGVNL